MCAVFLWHGAHSRYGWLIGWVAHGTGFGRRELRHETVEVVKASGTRQSAFLQLLVTTTHADYGHDDKEDDVDDAERGRNDDEHGAVAVVFGAGGLLCIHAILVDEHVGRFTSVSICRESESIIARAAIATLQLYAVVFTATIVCQTLVDICAFCSIHWRQEFALPAET